MKFPDGVPDLNHRDKITVRIANAVTNNTFKVITAFCRAGVHVSVENPHNSLLWRCKAYQKWAATFNVHEVVVDYCQFGEPYRKRTRLVTWGPGMQSHSFLVALARRCPGVCANHGHVNLSGWRPRVDGDIAPEMRTTKGTAAYPLTLCETWADVVANHCR